MVFDNDFAEFHHHSALGSYPYLFCLQIINVVCYSRKLNLQQSHMHCGQIGFWSSTGRCKKVPMLKRDFPPRCCSSTVYAKLMSYHCLDVCAQATCDLEALNHLETPQHTRVTNRIITLHETSRPTLCAFGGETIEHWIRLNKGSALRKSSSAFLELLNEHSKMVYAKKVLKNQHNTVCVF